MIKGSGSAGPGSFVKPLHFQGTGDGRGMLLPDKEKDTDYIKAKTSFYRELHQFQDSRGITVKENLKINGKEIDLYLLYQVVTSRGGWEKVNIKDEWDDLLQHFCIPKATNSSVVMKRIYLKNLELYEKIHFLGEDVDTKNDEDDEYDDFKHRRRYNLLKPSGYNSPAPINPIPSQPVVITDIMREQLGLAKEMGSTEYDRLLLSLQSPLPNEQDMAISVCTLLSNETKHALKFDKSPAVMEMLLAHAGIYNHCNTRILMEETYEKGRGLNFHEFWKHTVSNSDVRELLCECSLERYQNGIGIVPVGLDDSYDEDVREISDKTDEEVPMEEEYPKQELTPMDTVLDQPISFQTSAASTSIEECVEFQSQLEKSELLSQDVVDGVSLVQIKFKSSSDQLSEQILTDNEMEDVAVEDVSLPNGIENRNDCKCPTEEHVPSRSDELGEIEFMNSSVSCALNDEDEYEEDMEDIGPPGVEKEVLWDLLDKDVTASNVDCESCCPRCPCLRQPTIFEEAATEEDMDILSLEKYSKTTEKIGQRIYQVASIIRNLSFDKVNAEIMGHNSCILRFILVTANCSYGSLSQLSFDTLGNIGRYMSLEDPIENPYFSMVLSLVTDGIFSGDRFRILRSLETLREWSREESNEAVLTRVMDVKFFNRLCELLTLSDIMLLIYTLECLLSITSMGVEGFCELLAHTHGAVETLVSLVTVEAQSYGPKGCIHMRVVETVVGHPALQPVHPATSGTDNLSVPPSITQPPSLPRPVVVLPIKSPNSTSPSAFIATTVQQSPIKIKVEKDSLPIQTVSIQVASPIPAPMITSTSNQTLSTNLPIPQVLPSSSLAEPRLPRLGLNSSLTQHFQPPLNPLSVSTAAHNGLHFSPRRSSLSPGCHIPQAQSLPIAQPDPQVYSPSISMLTSGRALSEDAWAVLWMKAAFEQIPGCSIEQGKMYRMYCSARKEPNLVLTMESFINCVKCTYGGGIGPVIKNFSGTPLSFLDGLRPKMTLANVGTSAVMGQPNIIKISLGEANQNKRVELSNEQNSLSTICDQHIPPRENKTTSPILKATLSRPPKTPKNTTSKKQKGNKVKKSRSGSDESHSVVNPTSSAIRSLLASKVTQRQQKKLQQSDSKKGGGKNCKEKAVAGRKKGVGKKEANVKVNGIDVVVKTEVPEISSTSSSLQSSGSVDSVNPPPLISFQGILRNGLGNDSGKNDFMGNSKEELKPLQLHQGTKFKGMLVDLLERKVIPRENVNGLVGNREIRISDRGLELVDASETESNSNSNPPSAFSMTSFNHVSTSGFHFNAPVVNYNPNLVGKVKVEPSSEDDESQKMTFYSAPDPPVPTGGVTKNCGIEEQRKHCFGVSEDEMVLMSGGGGDGRSSSVDHDTNQQETVEISMDDAELLEKFNEISDLIVVPPEQFGLKRTRSVSQENSVTNEEPPSKKKAPTKRKTPTKKNVSSMLKIQKTTPIEFCPTYKGNPLISLGGVSNEQMRRWGLEVDFSEEMLKAPLEFLAKKQLTRVRMSPAEEEAVGVDPETGYPKVPTSSVLKYYKEFKKLVDDMILEDPTSTAIVKLERKNVNFFEDDDQIQSSVSQIPTQSTPIDESVNILQDSPSTMAITTSSNGIGISPSQARPLIQVPIRLTAVNRPSSTAQYTFARPLVFSAGQQIILQTPNTPGSLHGAKVLISRPPANSLGDQRPQAYFILQQPNQQSSNLNISSNTGATIKFSTLSGIPLTTTSTTFPVVTSTSNSNVVTAANTKRAPTTTVRVGMPVLNSVSIGTRSTTSNVPVTNPASPLPPPSRKTEEQLDLEVPHLCEWLGCGERFLKHEQLLMHALQTHTPESLIDAIRCEWHTSGCDGLLRKRFSLMTHLQDRHCSKSALEIALYRRKNKIETPPPPQPPVNHLGYAPNAAFHAIRRHALQFMNPKEMMDDNEGPVTKSIRLTSTLILKNLVNYSQSGRRSLKRFESQLASVAMSTLESSRTVSQLLHDLNEFGT